MAEISQPKLKYADNDVLTRFANRVVLFIDPKFSDDSPDDPLSDINIALNKVIDYGRRSNLTENEFMLALDMAPKGLLEIDGEKVKFFREINQAQLGQYEAGYIEFKSRDNKFQNAKDKISLFLNPPPPELSPEEYEIITLNNIRNDYHRFKADGRVLATPIFYDLIKKTGIEKVKLSFVENYLKNFVPEISEGKLSSGGTALPKVVKKDAYVEFQNEMIVHYVIHLKLHELTEDEWVEQWKKLLNEPRTKKLS